MSDRVGFVCNGVDVEVDGADGNSLLTALREQLGIVSAKDGCAPQGQCGCCTVLVDGDARVACVTPVGRVAGRAVTTVEGLDRAERDHLAAQLLAAGGSQCGFCTPGILVRAASLRAKGKVSAVGLDRGLAAHLCRCTGWQTVYEALGATSVPSRTTDGAARRAELEGGKPQRVGPDVPLGAGGFSDDTAPRDALVAVPLPPGSGAEFVEAAGLRWVVGESSVEARARAGKVQGRRTTVEARPPLPARDLPEGGVRLATSWVEPGYLEPDASWCAPGGEPASPLANGGAFGGKETSPVASAARELADRYGRTVRAVFSREDVVRLGPKRPPVALSAVLRDGSVRIEGIVAGSRWSDDPGAGVRYRLGVFAELSPNPVAGPPISRSLRARGAELRVLVEGALDEAGFDRAGNVVDERAAAVLLDNAVGYGDAVAGARVHVDGTTGAVERVEIRVAAGDPLDEVVLRSYAIGAVHMALGWVLTEGLAVDVGTGEVHDLSIRSFGIIRPQDMPPVDVTIVDDPRSPLARSSDAVFAAVAASAWNAVARAEGERPASFPALATRAARKLRR